MNDILDSKPWSESKGVSFVFRGMLTALAVNVLLVILMFIFRESAGMLGVAYTGWVVAQCGLCCTAFQRTDELRPGAMLLFFVLVMFSGFAGGAILAREDQTLTGEPVVFVIGIGAFVGLALHFIPVLILKHVIVRDGTVQFSIWQIMLFTAVIGVILTALMLVGGMALGIGMILMLLFGPSFLCGLVLNFIDRWTWFLPVVAIVSGITLALTMLGWPNSMVVGLYLGSQILGSAIGGFVLLQVPRSLPSVTPLPERSLEEPTDPFDSPPAESEAATSEIEFH